MSLRPCVVPGCAEVTATGYCAAHEGLRQERAAAVDAQRPNATQRLYGKKWRATRLIWLAAHPLCVLCQLAGRITAATVVDHVIPHRGDLKLFWRRSNWQSLCETCHNRKTATEDSAFAKSEQRVIAQSGGGIDDTGRISMTPSIRRT